MSSFLFGESRSIEIPADVAQLLVDLGVRTKEKEDNSKVHILTEDACRRAFVPFEFFQVFAELTRASDFVGGNAADRLLEYRRRRAERNREEKIGEGQQSPSLFRLPSLSQVHEQIKLSAVTFLEPFFVGLQQELDHQVDEHEAKAMGMALSVLDTGAGKDPPVAGQSSLQNAALVRERMVTLRDEPCWLTPEAMRIGLFGAVNGELYHEVDYVLFFDRVTTKAVEFQCRNIPAMDDITRGLFFDPKDTPLAVRKAAASSVMLEVKIRDSDEKVIDKVNGSGVAILYPGYILTARHVIRDFTKERDGKMYFPVTLVFGENRLETEAEVIEVPPSDSGPSPDLAILYVPDLPRSLEPLQFSKRVVVARFEKKPPRKNEQVAAFPKALGRPYGPFFGRYNYDIPSILNNYLDRERERPVYPREKIYTIGVPVQEGSKHLLVSAGQIDDQLHTDYSALVYTTAIALPGNSGGPAVDADGNVAGIVVQFARESDVLPRGTDPVSYESGMNFPKNYFKEPWQIPEQVPENDQPYRWKLPPFPRFNHEPPPIAFSSPLEGTGERIVRSKIYPMAEWGPAIRQAIESHRRAQGNAQPLAGLRRQIRTVFSKYWPW